MQSKGLWGKKYLDIQERTYELAPAGDDRVIVEVKACGMCGTDINFVRDWSDDPMALGHEISAEVLEVGKNVTTVKPGDTVIVEDVSMCGVCEDCKSGHPEFCRNMHSIEGQPGMGQYMSVRYNSCVKYEGLDHVTASLTEPLAVCLTAVLTAEIPLGGSVLVLGPGPLGLMTAQLAKLKGAGWVGITGHCCNTPREQARMAAAAKFGCDMTIDAAEGNVEEQVKQVFPKGVDRVIASSPPRSLYDGLKAIKYGGIITFFGLHFGGESTIEVDVNDLIFRKIQLRPAFAEPAINFPISNRLLRDGLVDGKALVTHTFGFDQACETFKAVIDGSEPVIKAVMLPNG
ncbi:MAG: alcohol dehydrogenase catalytic domain-containing protein [Anaerolineae bacterium]|jgi:L-iditol 2-dehydrogenase|nr:alcohol dehydrogenase catalytic domain-containing protein [Anaerolineae bacterium]